MHGFASDRRLIQPLGDRSDGVGRGMVRAGGSQTGPIIREAVMSQSRAGRSRTTRGAVFAMIGRCVALGLLAALPGGPLRPPDGRAQALVPAPPSSTPTAPAPGQRVGDL